MVWILAVPRLVLCALVALAPIPTEFAEKAENDGPRSATASEQGGGTAGPAITLPDGDISQDDDGEEEATLEGHAYAVDSQPRPGVLLHLSYERGLRYPTFRPPRRPLA